MTARTGVIGSTNFQRGGVTFGTILPIEFDIMNRFVVVYLPWHAVRFRCKCRWFGLAAIHQSILSSCMLMSRILLLVVVLSMMCLG